jgi:hypothetical protein
MLRAVSVHTAPRRSRWLVSFVAVAALLTVGAHAAAAQSSADVTMWTPTDEKVSLHLHGGLFLPIDVNAPSPTFGLRLSKLVGSHLQVGILTGWTFERKDLTTGGDSLPGSEPQLVLARVESHLVPLMGYIRVNLTEKHWLVPYVGVGTGYEWLTFQATDYRSQLTGSATYANWAWEGWLGLGIRLGQDLRVNGEAYYNGASLERDVIDESGNIWKEVVKMDGVGLRLGVDIIFQ